MQADYFIACSYIIFIHFFAVNSYVSIYRIVKEYQPDETESEANYLIASMSFLNPVLAKCLAANYIPIYNI